MSCFFKSCSEYDRVVLIEIFYNFTKIPTISSVIKRTWPSIINSQLLWRNFICCFIIYNTTSEKSIFQNSSCTSSCGFIIKMYYISCGSGRNIYRTSKCLLNGRICSRIKKYTDFITYSIGKSFGIINKSICINRGNKHRKNTTSILKKYHKLHLLFICCNSISCIHICITWIKCSSCRYFCYISYLIFCKSLKGNISS